MGRKILLIRCEWLKRLCIVEASNRVVVEDEGVVERRLVKKRQEIAALAPKQSCNSEESLAAHSGRRYAQLVSVMALGNWH